jgi:hypothetical protein
MTHVRAFAAPGTPPPAHETTRGSESTMASYTVNKRAVAHAKQLIDAHQYVLRSTWDEVQPRAADENSFLETHSWEDYAAWHLRSPTGRRTRRRPDTHSSAETSGASTRMGLIACHYRAAEWEHKEVELAAHDLLQYLDQERA